MKKRYAVCKLDDSLPPNLLTTIRDDFETEESAWNWIYNKSVERDNDCGKFTVVPYITKHF